MADVLFATLQVPGTAQLDFALAQQQGQGLVNAANSVDSCALHVAVWRGGVDAVQRLLDAGASPDQQDGESGWTPLHKALYLGNIQAAAALLRAGASLDMADHKGRLPLDLLADELRAQWHGRQAQPAAAGGPSRSSSHGSHGSQRGGAGAGSAGGSIVFSWGNGANLQLGTGSTDLHLAPVRIDSLMHAAHITALTAAKYHSAAVGSDGSVYTWGWGRGGRLGHPDFFIHSGQAAQILPRRVDGLGQRQVVSIAAAKHHTLAATSSGELFSWGSNKDGRLGYAAPDTQPVPRKVALLRPRIVAVAAANKHSAAVSAFGEVFTWGANSHGQLGYGTSDSGSNPVPRVVEAMKGRHLVHVAAAKYHTVVLTAEGDIYQWGHKVVTPRYISLAGSRDTARAGPAPPATATGGTSQAAAASTSGSGTSGSMRFHRGQGEVSRPLAVAVAAGMAHTSCITRAGVVLAWRSDAAQGPVREVGGALAGKRAVQLSAGKHRTAVVTDSGDVYAWEAKNKQHKSKEQHDSGAQAAAPQGATAAATAFAVAAAAAACSVPEASAAVAAAAASADSTAGHSPPSAHLQLLSQQEEAAAGTRSNSADAGASSSLGSADAPIQPERVAGLRRATVVAVGEKHSLALQRWSAPTLPSDHDRHLSMLAPLRQPLQLALPAEGAGDDAGSDGAESLSPHAAGRQGAAIKRGEWNAAADGLVAGAGPGSASSSRTRTANRAAAADGTSFGQYAHARSSSNGSGSDSSSDSRSSVPRLQQICEHVVATQLVEPRTTLPILEYADVAGAQLLRSFCLAVALRNMDVVMQEARASVEATPAHLFKELERHFKAALLGCIAAAAVPAADASAPSVQNDAAVQQSAPAARSNRGVVSQQQQETTSAAQLPPPPPPPPQHIFSTLQRGCRPTAAPAWLTADTDYDISEPCLIPEPSSQAAAGTAGRAALAAGGDGGGFTTAGGSQAAAAQEAAQKLQRNVVKKLQQIAHLEQRQQEGVALDWQQLAKANQKASLMEALRLLQQSGPSAHAQASALVAQAQATAAKLTSWAESAAAASPMGASTASGIGDSLRQRSKTQLGKPGGSVGSTGSVGATAAAPSGGAEPVAAAAAEQRQTSGSTPPVGQQASAAELTAVQAQLLAAEVALGVEDGPTTGLAAAAVAAAAAAADQQAGSSKTPKRTPSQLRKGDLSVFLRGALDKPPQPVAAAAGAPATPAKSKGPAWGGVQPPSQQPGASLRELLSHKSSGSSNGSMATSALARSALLPQEPAAPRPQPSAPQPSSQATTSNPAGGSCPSPSSSSAAAGAATPEGTVAATSTSRSAAAATSPGLPPQQRPSTTGASRSAAAATSPGLSTPQQRPSTSTASTSGPAGVNSPTPPLPQPRRANSALHAALQRQALLPAVGKSPFSTPAGKPGPSSTSLHPTLALKSAGSDASSSGINVSLFDLLNAKRPAPAAVLRSPAAASPSAASSKSDVASMPAWGGARGSSPPGPTRQQQQKQQQVPESPQPKAQSLREIQAEQERLRATTGFAALQRERAAAAAGASSAPMAAAHSGSAGRGAVHALGSSPQHSSPLALMAAAGGISGAVNSASGDRGGVLGSSPGSASRGMGSWGSGLPASSPPMQSKWYVSEQPHMRSLADIQNEEVAAQQEAASKLLAQMLEEQERAKAAEAKRQAKAVQRAARKARAQQAAAEAGAAGDEAGVAGKAPSTAKPQCASQAGAEAGAADKAARQGKAEQAGREGSGNWAPKAAAEGGARIEAAAAAAAGGSRRRGSKQHERAAGSIPNSQHTPGARAPAAQRGAADVEGPSAAVGVAGEQQSRLARSRQQQRHGDGDGHADAAAGQSGPCASDRKAQHGRGAAGGEGEQPSVASSRVWGESPDVAPARDAGSHGSRERGSSRRTADGPGRGAGAQRGAHTSSRGGRGGGRGSGDSGSANSKAGSSPAGRGHRSNGAGQQQPQHTVVAARPAAAAPAGPT